MRNFKAKSPTRVDLAGGTLDLWPIYTFFDKAVTVNVAVDIFTYAELTERSDHRVHLRIDDMNAEITYPSLQACLVDEDPRFRLLREHIRFWNPPIGFDLKTKSESPVGGGLGGSSSLSISLLGVFSNFMDKKLSVSQAVMIASNIEAKVLHVPTGTQDYYPALLGGLNVLHYSHEGCRPEKFVNKSTIKTIEEHFILVYTGRPHQSGLNNWEVLKQAIEEKGDTLKCLARLKNTADDMKNSLNSNNIKALRSLLNHEYDARVQLSPVFSSPEIERLRKVALSSGAEAVKICGAGGGGCVMIWCPPDSKKGVAQECQNAGFQVLPARPIEQGLEVAVSV